MLTIEEIKAAVPYADGWEIYDEFIKTPEARWLIEQLMPSREWEKIYLPLFLTRVSEGMNREHEIKITTDDIGISVYRNGATTAFLFSNYPTIDHAKAACISEVLRRVKG